MNPMKSKNVKFAILVVALSSLVVGCHTPPPPVAWNIHITKVTTASVTVDLMGISRTEDGYWRNSVKPSDYWNPNRPIRKEAAARARTTDFKDQKEFLLSGEDPIWGQWISYGAFELMIMADLPGINDNSPSDPRRVFLPLNKKQWQTKNKTIEVEISDSQVRVLTPQQP
jgi:hypothetical protein